MVGRWLSRRAIVLHLTLAVVVPTFLVLCDWQVHRALAGNDLSWAYVFEWPFFAAYALHMWWRFIHEDQPAPSAGGGGSAEVTLEEPVERSAERPVEAASVPDTAARDAAAADDEELAAYNRYLAALHSGARRKHW
jgi:hypothetical protein